MTRIDLEACEWEDWRLGLAMYVAEEVRLRLVCNKCGKFKTFNKI